MLCHLASPFTYFKSTVQDTWSAKVARDLSARQGFLSGSFLDMKGSLRLLRSSHVRSRDKGLLRGILSGVGGCGTDFFSNEFEEKLFLVGFVGS